jgi:DNA-binding transcriptional ArsR family regulator
MELAVVKSSEAAGALLDPLRARIVEEAGQPVSAAEVARRLGQPRQKVNYHVRQLAEVGVLEPAGEVRKGNMFEKRYRATARSYVLAPQLLGSLAPGREAPADRFSADALLALFARSMGELIQVRSEAAEQGRRVSTLSIEADVGFESAEQRAEFARALESAITDVVGRFTAPPRAVSGSTPRPFRLVIGCHPRPPEVEMSADSEGGSA